MTLESSCSLIKTSFMEEVVKNKATVEWKQIDRDCNHSADVLARESLSMDTIYKVFDEVPPFLRDPLVVDLGDLGLPSE